MGASFVPQAYSNPRAWALHKTATLDPGPVRTAPLEAARARVCKISVGPPPRTVRTPHALTSCLEPLLDDDDLLPKHCSKRLPSLQHLLEPSVRSPGCVNEPPRYRR
jgi:hypothetical protein